MDYGFGNYYLKEDGESVEIDERLFEIDPLVFNLIQCLHDKLIECDQIEWIEIGEITVDPSDLH